MEGIEAGKLSGGQVDFTTGNLKARAPSEALTTPRTGVQVRSPGSRNRVIDSGGRTRVTGCRKGSALPARQYVTNGKSVPAGVAREPCDWPAPEMGEGGKGKGKTSRQFSVKQRSSHLGKVQITLCGGRGRTTALKRKSLSSKTESPRTGYYRMETCRHAILCFLHLTMNSDISNAEA